MPAPIRHLGRTAIVALGWRVPGELVDEEHPERLAVLNRLPDAGTIAEIGCGHRKTRGDLIGIDMIAGGARGLVGNVAGRKSTADVAALGDQLPLAAGALDFLVARHNLEHYVDLVAVLREWHRVVRPGGTFIAVVPDEERCTGSTLALDPTHYHAFSEAALGSLLPLVGWQPEEIGPCIEGWSLLVVARRIDA